MSLRWSEPFQPFLKWPGGKRWAASDIIGFARPALKGTYYEPFLGGGAVYFSLQPNKAVLGDINGKLVDTYIAVRDHIDEVIRALRRLEVSEHEYYRIRESKPIKLSRRAARFLYLNRTAFGGIYRENKQGQFNVPFGGGQRTPAILWETDLLRKASQLLSKAIIFQSDFEPLMDEAVKGDVIYCDPSYVVAHNNNGFLRYNERIFNWADQKRLSQAAHRAARRGVTVIVSNANDKSVHALYPRVEEKVLCRFCAASARVEGRRRVEECLFIIRPQS